MLAKDPVVLYPCSALPLFLDTIFNVFVAFVIHFWYSIIIHCLIDSGLKLCTDHVSVQEVNPNTDMNLGWTKADFNN